MEIKIIYDNKTYPFSTEGSDISVQKMVHIIKKDSAFKSLRDKRKKKQVGDSFYLTNNKQRLGPSYKIQSGAKIYLKDIMIVLDLDETLLHTIHKSQYHSKLDTTNIHFKVMDDDKDDDDPYIVFVRPHLYEFLDYIFKHFKVCIWTAASKDYALWIIKNILNKTSTGTIVHRKLTLFLSSEHCDISYEIKDGHKVLSLWKDEFKLDVLAPETFSDDNVYILFDDSYDAYISNKKEDQIHFCVRVKAWEMKNKQLDKQDDELKRLIKELKSPVPFSQKSILKKNKNK